MIDKQIPLIQLYIRALPHSVENVADIEETSYAYCDKSVGKMRNISLTPHNFRLSIPNFLVILALLHSISCTNFPSLVTTLPWYVIFRLVASPELTS